VIVTDHAGHPDLPPGAAEARIRQSGRLAGPSGFNLVSVTTSADTPYEALYVEHQPAARRLALSLVPPHAADEVVAEAFTRVLDTAGRNGPPAAFRPYLMAAVRNTARTYHERGRRLVPVPVPELPPVTGPLRALVEREDARLAGQAFAVLPERWRQVLWATAVEEVTVAALANRLGMTANSVSQLASRAREGLRQAYLTAHLGSDMAPQCRAVAKYMGASVRGRATRRHQAELMAHLATCPRCTQAHAGLAALNSHLGGLIGPGAAGAEVLAAASGL
jgi:RNA polymerase sigma factor (sigma-70 family)